MRGRNRGCLYLRSSEEDDSTRYKKPESRDFSLEIHATTLGRSLTLKHDNTTSQVLYVIIYSSKKDSKPSSPKYNPGSVKALTDHGPLVKDLD